MSDHSTKTYFKRERLQRLTISAVFVALSCVAKFFQITIPILGASGMHISAAGIFSTIPALLFGPVYGGTVAGLVDVIGYFMTGGKDGPFVPILTATAVLCGVLKGIFWTLFLKIEQEKFQKTLKIVCGVLFPAVLLFGVWNWISLSFLPDFVWTRVLSLLKGKVSFATFGLMITGGGGLLCMLAAKYIGKWATKLETPQVFQLLGTLAISNITITTINTFILMDLYSISSAFPVFYIPRLIEELIMIVIQSFFIAWVLVLVRKIGGTAISKERI